MDKWPFWAELLIRSSVLLLAAHALRSSLRAHSAALRHRVLLAGLLLLGFLPVLAIILPEIPIAIWNPRQHESAAITVQEIAASPLPDAAPHRIDWLILIWATGVLAALSPIAAGAISVRRVVRRARPFECAASGADVLISDEIAAPITCGFLHPRVVLPTSAREWSRNRLKAVLAHEFAHIRRRDVPVQLAVHAISALWWFQPLVWILRRTLRSDSELACDAEVLRTGLRPSIYAAELLEVARSLGAPNQALSSCGIDMAAGSNLQHRVEMILQYRAPATPFFRKIALAAALLAVSIGASAITPNAGTGFFEQGGSTMKRTLISGLLTSVGLTAATISGTVHDPSGTAVADAAVTVLNPDTGARQNVVTDSEGKFSVSGDGAGQYILKIQKQGFTPVLREFDLKAESNMSRELTMPLEGSSSQAVDLVTDTSDSTKPLNVGGRVAESNLISRVQPVYPAAAKATATQGTVQIRATISKDGVPVDLQVISSPSSDLAESALQAVRQWRYRPTLLNGEPVEITTLVIVTYTLVP
jgi:TonB family protein